MKLITRSSIYLPMAAMILTSALAVTAAAQNFLRRRILQRYVPRDRTPITSFRRGLPLHSMLHTTATGTGAYLGQFSLIRELTGNGS